MSLFHVYLHDPLALAGFLGFLLGYDLATFWNGSGGEKSVGIGKRNCLSHSEMHNRQQIKLHIMQTNSYINKQKASDIARRYRKLLTTNVKLLLF